MKSLKGIKARPHDLEAMLLHRPSLVELHCSVDDLRWEPQRRYDIPLAVHLPEYDKGRLIDPASLNEAERQAAADLYAHAVERAAVWAPFFLGAPKVVFHPGGMAVYRPTSKGLADMRRQLSKTIRAMQAAAGPEVEVLIENLPKHCWFFGGEWLAGICTTAEEIEAICEEHGLGLTLDLCHLYLAAQAQDFDMQAAIARVKPLVRHIHYSGASGVDGEGLAIGDANNSFDVATALRSLAGVDAVAVPEVWFGHEYGGAGFVRAWEEAEVRLTALQEAAAWPS